MNFYTYKAKLTKIIDADTVDTEIDLGFEVFKKVRCRLAGIDAPELRTEAGKIAKQFLIDTIPLNSDVIIESKKYDKYGRSLAIIYFNNININQLLIDKGHATVYVE